MASYEEMRKLSYAFLTDVVELARAAKLDEDEVLSVARAEITGYLMYLCCSDGKVTQRECTTVEAITGYSYSPAEMTAFVKEHHIYSEMFEETVPKTLQFLVKIDQILGERKYAERMVNFYLEFAKMLVNADGDVDDQEVTDTAIYITMMKDYISRTR